MNYFAHALPFLNGQSDPYFIAGTGVPDWLTVVDRKVRVREKYTADFIADADPLVAAVAQGAAQHLRDDRQFHGTRAFAELCIEVSAEASRVLGGEIDLRSGFLGHLLVELLLDADLAVEQTDRLEAYYRLLDEVDEQLVEDAVNRIAPRQTTRLAEMISVFRRLRILWDYFEDAKLMVRVNQVMRRLKLEPIPDSFQEILPDFRRRVSARKDELLDGIPA